MWQALISKFGFESILSDDDHSSSGKWLVPIALGDPDGIWQKLQQAAHEGQVTAVKISAPPLDDVLGHHLVCAYCPSSHENHVVPALSVLRRLGVKDQIRYKSDKATVEARDEYLWDSRDLISQ